MINNKKIQMKKQKTLTDKLNQLTRISSYLTKEQYHTQLDKIFNEWESKKNYKEIDAICSDNYENNIDKYGYTDGPQCHCCGLPLKNDDYMIHMTTDGKIVPVNVNEEDVEDSQGWFEIGPECRKKYPSEYIYKRN